MSNANYAILTALVLIGVALGANCRNYMESKPSHFHWVLQGSVDGTNYYRAERCTEKHP